MDKLEFMNVVSDVYAECKTEEEIASRMSQMLDCVKVQAYLSVDYLKAGILNSTSETEGE